MKPISFRLLQVLLGSIAAFHTVIGLGLNTSPAFARFMAEWYGATEVNWNEKSLYIVRPLGAFMFVLGGLAAVAALNPSRHRAIIYAFASLFILRSLQRLAFREEIFSFGIPPERNLINMFFFLTLAILLLVLHRYTEKQSAAGSRG
jgi:hypothetical protein